MTRKSFLVLFGVTALSVLAAVVVTLLDRGAPAMALAGQRLLPGLDAASSDIARLVVRDGGVQTVVERRDGVYVDAASGYPVETEVLQELVGALTLAEIAEAKTADPARYADLGLAPPDAEKGAGREIVLEDGDGEAIAHVIVGDRDYTLGGLAGGQFARRGGEDETWLVRARIDPPSRRAGWFDTRLFEAEESEILRASLSPGEGEAIEFAREDGAFVLKAELPEGRAARGGQVDRIPRFFTALDFDDVRETGDAEETGAKISAETADGVKITLAALAGPDDDRAWVRIAVAGSGEAADTLRARVEGFEFALSSYDAQLFGWTLDDLTETVES
ncbi:DUF4340 domain-containing protein [Pikeienuella sp. HZG-20]|uniref:DUF4340 domain-containing protein n=1 Tax=Paludibacillus litoralis TaxID=3133267 RepID=UPI0030EB54CB